MILEFQSSVHSRFYWNRKIVRSIRLLELLLFELELFENQKEQSSTSNKPHLAEKRISTRCSLAGDYSCSMFTRCLREKLSLSSSSWRSRPQSPQQQTSKSVSLTCLLECSPFRLKAVICYLVFTALKES